MALKDVEKLKEKVSKDPNSRLFVPLAEEYRKEGMTEDAIDVLRAGLERQPGYMSARVALGKIYLEKGMQAEAREEFENVVKSIPDNLYAQKKLAEIYRDAGEKDLAIKSYRAVLKLNSMDEEAMFNLHDLEKNGGEADAPEVQNVAEAAAAVDAETGAGDAIFDDFVVADSSHEEVQAEPVPAEEELDAFRDSIFAEKEEKTGGDGAPPQSGIQGIWDKQFEVVSGVSAEPAHEIAEEVPDAEESAEDPSGKAVFGKAHYEQIKEDFKMAPAPEEIKSEPLVSSPEKKSELSSSGAPASIDIEKVTAEADVLISRGDYAGALGIYRNVLSSNPGEKRILQRADELRALLKLTGRDKNTLIAQLNSFLEGIMKRRNGLPGNS